MGAVLGQVNLHLRFPCPSWRSMLAGVNSCVCCLESGAWAPWRHSTDSIGFRQRQPCPHNHTCHCSHLCGEQEVAQIWGHGGLRR